MATHVDDREDLEPGAGITDAPIPDGLIGLDVNDPFAGYADYFGFNEEGIWYFPDGKQWMKFKKLTEGARAKYQKLTRPDVVINQKSGDAKVPFDQSADRKELILASVFEWHVVRRSPRTGNIELVPLTLGSGGSLAQWIQNANPAHVASLEKEIRKANPWMMNEMSVEQIEKEIADLEELKVVAREREEQEKSFH